MTITATVTDLKYCDILQKSSRPGDYLALARAYDILLIENVPILKQVHREQARRFITLIDTLYDNGVRLVLSADAEPGALYAMTRGAELFERTASRLIEMRSQEYLARARGEEVGLDAG